MNPGAVRVADSFLVVDGKTVAVDRHSARFATGVVAQGISLGVDPDRVFQSALDTIPREGRWFPRIEAVDYGDGTLLRFLVRPAPEAVENATVSTANHDPRHNPLIKGPDLAALGNLRRDSGADEAIILEDGAVAEGAWSSVMWWKDDRLHCVDSSIARLGSVTEAALIDHARYIGAPVNYARATPADLDGAEIWILSALHGIRVVTEWIDGPSVAIEPGRVEYWRQQYVNQRRSI